MECANIVPLQYAVRGLDLVGLADVVISGGGTMAREAAALGVPSYSIFTGREGAVDVRLAKEGRLTLVRDLEKIEAIKFRKRLKNSAIQTTEFTLLNFFLQQLSTLAEHPA
jgi:hypothetical protein